MDIRVLILAGTFALFVVALIIFVVTASRARREARFGTAPEMPEWTGISGSTGPLDTSLEGLEVRVAEDTPSAALLTPLKTGEWMPPESPAPAAELPKASLEERIAEFRPVPNIPEPAFAVDRFQEWEIAPDTPAPRAEPMPRPAQWAQSIPEVAVDQSGTPAAAAPTPSASDDAEEFEQELAALLPTVEFSAIGVPQAAEQPAPQPQPAPAPAPVPAPAAASAPAAPAAGARGVATGAAGDDAPREAASAPVADAAPAPAPAPEPEPVVLPVVVPLVGTSTPAASDGAAETPSHESPATVSAFDLPANVPQAPAVPDEPVVSPPDVLVPPVAEVAPTLSVVDDVPTPCTPDVTPPLDVVVPQAAASAPASVGPAAAPEQSPEPDAEGFWTEAMREQFARPAPARPDRPVVTVTARPEPQPEPAIEPAVRARPRPVVRVHTLAGEEGGVTVAPPSVPSAAPDAPRRLSARFAPDVPEVVMAAPVEMWFGDARIGVKAGTPTYDRFRKYADVLFADLKASQAMRR